MVLKRLTFISLISAFTVPSVSAIIFIEPGVGYSVSSFKQKHGTTTGVANTEMSANTGGLTFDLKAGLDVPFVYLGPYLNVSLPRFKASNGWAQLSSDTSAKTRIAVGAMAGVKVPVIPLKVYGGYQFLNQLDLKSTEGGGNDAYYKGKGFMVGLGYVIDLPVPILGLSINVQYHRETYDVQSNVVGNNGKLEFTLPALVPDDNTNFSDVYFEKASADRIFFFVSLPITI